MLIKTFGARPLLHAAVHGARIYAPVSAVTVKVKIFKSILMTQMWKSDLGDTSETRS